MSAEQQIHVIFNPISGQGDSGRELETLESCLAGVGNLVVHLTSEDVDGNILAKQALSEGADLIVASGGDGTVSGVAAALINTDVPLGIIPRGTVNAFASAMNIPESIADACELIKQGHTRRVDTARCNDRSLLLLASIGFEADLMEETDRETKNKYGKLAILVNGLKQLQNLQAFELTIEMRDDSQEFNASAVVAANAATLATFLAQGPEEVEVSDGNLDVTVIRPEGRWDAITSAADLFFSGLFNRAAQHDMVTHLRAPQITITANPAQKVLVDGELVGKTPIDIECLKHSLIVVVPES
ncbi:MAG: YegS/Rv2252/BmrU family lipid kinase [Leptolyngbyaceae cyanobacterium]